MPPWFLTTYTYKYALLTILFVCDLHDYSNYRISNMTFFKWKDTFLIQCDHIWRLIATLLRLLRSISW